MLHVISGLHLGGAETLLYQLATRSPPNIEHRVICLGEREWYSDLLEERGVPVDHLGTRAANLPSRLITLRRLIRESCADVVQSWLYVANLLSGICARSSGIPVVWGVHAASIDDIEGVSRLCAIAGGWASNWLADFAINCSSRTAESHAARGYGVLPSAVVHNGYDPAVFRPDEKARSREREKLGFPPTTFLIGSVARWHPHKDVPNLLRALRIASDTGARLRCLLIGRGLAPDNPGLAAEIRKSGAEGLVVPLGLRSDLPSQLPALDLHVLSSRSEAFPNAVAESMLSAVPNVVTDVGDSAMMVGETGWSVPAGDPAKLAGAIVDAYREWADDRQAWERRRANARSRIADRFTFEKMASGYEDVWRSVARNA